MANEAVVNEFCGCLVADLSEPFAAASGRRPLVREKLWKVLWAVRSSSFYTTRWVAFCERACARATPILYQHLTDLILIRRIMREKFEIRHHQSADAQEMSYNEANVLRYAAGYVVRHVSKKIQNNHLPHVRTRL